MKVLHVISSMAREYGGPIAAVRHMAVGLQALKIGVDVATTTANMTGASPPTKSFVEEDGIRVITFATHFPQACTSSLPMARWLWRNTKNYDLIHVHGVFSFPCLIGCRAALRAARPYVLRPAGMLDPWCRQSKSWKKWPYYKVAEERNLRHAAAIHTTSESEAVSLAALGFGSRTVVIPLGLRIPSKLVQANEGDSKEVLRVLFLSRLHPIKRLPLLLDAVQSLIQAGSRVSLTIAGSGDEGYEKVLRERARKLDLEQYVQFVGFVSGEEKARLLRTAHVFVLPSFHENFGVAVVEAMSYGIPVVVSNQVALATEIERASAGTVVSRFAPLDVAKAIAKYRDPIVRADAGRRGRALVQARFSIEAQNNALRALYERVLAGLPTALETRSEQSSQ